MQRQAKASLLLKLAGHWAMGASLGTGLAVSLIIMNARHIFEMIVSSSHPRITMIVFVGALGSVCAIGATITGFIFVLTENEHT